MGLSDKLHKRQKQLIAGGYSITDYVPPRLNHNGQLELHVPFANYEGPRTDIKRRLKEGVKPTTYTDAGAKVHDIAYHNIGSRLAKGQITKAQAAKQIKEADNKLLKTALKNKLSLNPTEHLHANAAIAGILGKKGLQSVGAMDELSFIGNDPEEIQGGKGGKKKDLVKGLKKRFKKLKV